MGTNAVFKESNFRSRNGLLWPGLLAGATAAIILLTSSEPANESSSALRQNTLSDPSATERIAVVAPAVSGIDKDSANVPRRRIRLSGDEGWTYVDTSEPDERVTGLDPSVLPMHELAIQEQLRENTYSGEMLEKVKRLFHAARGERTRELALEAIERSSDSGAAQRILREVLDESASEHERALIISKLQRLEQAQFGYLRK